MSFKMVIALSSALLIMSACDANTVSTTSVQGNKKQMAQSSEPIPQPGGYSNINNAKLKELVDQGVALVDIRRQEEWIQTGIVKGSKTITFFDKRGNINPNFVNDFTAAVKPDQPVMLICRTGNRTQAASQAIAQQLGYKNVMNVTHGITGWIAEKRPVTRYQ